MVEFPSNGSPISAVQRFRHDVTASKLFLADHWSEELRAGGADDGSPSQAIVAAELIRVRLPLRHALVSAHGTESIREIVLVRLIARDGVEGWGECSALEAPTYSDEYTDGAWMMLRDHLVPALLASRTSPDIGRGHPMARTAISTAMIDVHLRRQQISLAQALGASPDAGLSWTAVVGMPTMANSDVTHTADEAVDLGAEGLKIKVDPTCGAGVVGEFLAEFAAMPLAVDANGSYHGHEQAMVELADKLSNATHQWRSKHPIRGAIAPRVYVEQPLPRVDLAGTAVLAGQLALPVALDESIGSSADVVSACDLAACRIVNLKPARVGGIENAMTLLGSVGVRHSGEVPTMFLGGMVETGVGRATALAVGVALGLEATDLGPSGWYFDDDISEPIALGDDGLMHAPTGHGIGVTPRTDRLLTTLVERITLRR